MRLLLLNSSESLLVLLLTAGVLLVLLLTAGVWTCPLEGHCRKDPPPRTHALDSPAGIKRGDEESENKSGNLGTQRFGHGKNCLIVTKWEDQ